MDLTVEGKAFINGCIQQCCIGVRNGKICEIKKTLRGETHIKFTKKIIIPSGVDLHVHFRDPGFTYKEDFSSGSKAAIYGGITCIFDMPNTKPQTITGQSLLKKINDASNKSYVDFGLFAGINDNNIVYINDLAKYCNGFKIFLGGSTNSFLFDQRRLSEILKEISYTDKIVLIHAEDQNCLDKSKIKEKNLKDHMACRPSLCEESAIKNVLYSMNKLNSKIHICHLSSCDGFELLKQKPKNVSVGVTPHHILFDVNKITSKHSFYKVNPPIRTNFDRETLWQGLLDGHIDVIESDHAPHTIEDKDVDFDSAPSGMPGVETMYPLLLSMVKNKQMDLNRMISLICEKPAELMNVLKGKIEIGYDADFIVVDFKESTKIQSEKLHSKCNWSAFDGFSAIFPSDVFLRGNRVIEDNELSLNSGIGKYVL